MTHNKTSQSIETGRKKKQKIRLVGKDSKAILDIACMSRTDMHAQNTQSKILETECII